jgi:hypothetical protein
MSNWPRLDRKQDVSPPRTLRSRAVFAAIFFTSLILPLQCFAGPRVINETARIDNPDPSFGSFADDVAVLGDDAVVTALRSSEEYLPDYDYQRTAFLFTRNGQGAWQYISRLVTNPEYWGYPLAVAMDNGLMAIGAMESLDIFERGTSGWVHTAAPGGGGLMVDLELDNGTVTHDTDNSSAVVLRRNSAGEWAQVATLWGPRGVSEGEFLGAVDQDVSGDTVVISGYDAPEFEEGEGPQTYFYSNASGAYVQTGLFPHVGDVSISGDYTLLAQGAPQGIRVFRRDGGGWTLDGSVATADLFTRRYGMIEVEGDLAVLGNNAYDPTDENRRSVAVLQRDANGVFRHVADLVPSDSLTRSMFGHRVDIDGRRVIVSAYGAAYIFDLPPDLTQPATLQDDFEDGNAAGWTPVAGSNFSVVTSAGSQVLRQSSVTGEAAATLAADWTDQTIHADITPRAFNGANRWFGLAARKLDSANYYYVTLRSSNVVELKKIVNGAYETLASATLPIVLDRTYRVTLEAVGNLVRAFVDGKLVAQAHDSSLTHGAAGVQMYRTSADYDNVVVSPSPFTKVFEDEGLASMWRWTIGENSSWSVATEGSSQVYQQAAIETTTPRAITGADTDDQSITARARAVSFGSSPNAWFGLIARYVDDENYYYVTVRKDNTISLRKLVDGAIHVFDTAPLTVTPGAWYQFRFEVVGDRLRVYVDDDLVLEAADAQPIESGRYGMMTYRTIARFGDFIAWQP